MLRLCTTQIRYVANIARPKLGMLRRWANQIRYVATIAAQNVYVATLRYQIRHVATIATQNECVATTANKIRYRVCCDRCDSKWVCCDFSRPKKFYATSGDPQKICCDFARPNLGMLRLCATQLSYDATLRDPN